ncbi:MAG: dihydrodipicolinate synthase family protein [archaeon GB-1867-005]|nr:dihydrodipicolinate synthase family protein [Candidatus Culexmicrobium cathedralense]
MFSKFHGVIVPLITPFNEDLSIDFEACKWLVNYLAERGVNGIFPYSTTGEFVHLKQEEGLNLVKAVMDEISGRVWVLPGISSNCTEHSIEFGREVADLGVDGAIITPPFFFKIDNMKLKRHFSMVAQKVDLPLIIYNIPSATGINIPVSLYVDLANEFSNIVGAKITFDSISYMRRLIHEVKSVRKDFSILTGLDDHFLNTLIMGGDGGIMALANVAPQIHVEVYRCWKNGDLMGAVNTFEKLVRLAEIYDVASTFPTAVKTALKVVGAPVKPYVRPPLDLEPPDVERKIKLILGSVGLHKI